MCHVAAPAAAEAHVAGRTARRSAVGALGNEEVPAPLESHHAPHAEGGPDDQVCIISERNDGKFQVCNKQPGSGGRLPNGISGIFVGFGPSSGVWMEFRNARHADGERDDQV